MDGRQSFCYGVDPDWNPLTRECVVPMRREQELDKRQTFLENLQGNKLSDLLNDGGFFRRDEQGMIVHDVDRTLAMLVLTAIHDIMKVPSLLPIVEEEHAPDGWCGYPV